MSKKLVKLAVIRTNEEQSCPFGLPVPFGCKYAGGVINRMAPLSALGDDPKPSEKKKVSDANVKVLAYTLMGSSEEPSKCDYAAHIFDKKEAVECNYEDTAPGEGQKGALLGAPFYDQIFAGVGLNGLFSYPIGYYADYNISRNLYYGIFSLQGSDERTRELIKYAKRVIEAKKDTNKNE